MSNHVPSLHNGGFKISVGKPALLHEWQQRNADVSQSHSPARPDSSASPLPDAALAAADSPSKPDVPRMQLASGTLAQAHETNAAAGGSAADTAHTVSTCDISALASVAVMNVNDRSKMSLAAGYTVAHGAGDQRTTDAANLPTLVTNPPAKQSNDMRQSSKNSEHSSDDALRFSHQSSTCNLLNAITHSFALCVDTDTSALACTCM